MDQDLPDGDPYDDLFWLDTLHCEYDQIYRFADSPCSLHLRPRHCQSAEASKPWAHESLLVEIPVPTDQNSFVFHCRLCDHGISGIDRHHITQPHNIMAKINKG